MKRILNLFCATTVVAMLAVSAGAQNYLANPGFEDPITMDGPPFDGFWEAFTGQATDSSANSTAMPLSGAQSLELIIDAANVNSFAGVFQDVRGVNPGTEGTFSGWHKSLQEPGGTEIRIEWRDSVNDVEVSRTPNFTPTPGSDYEEFALTAEVPAGANTARVVYAIQSFGAAAGQLVYVDDVKFNIPEPASFALLGGAGLLLVTFRRRS